MKTIGIVAHSAEGAALCFLTACREGAKALGPHMHPEIVLSAVPMALSIPGWEAGDHDAVAQWLLKGIRQVADAGADFFVCPDNTAHLVLERVVDHAPIPGLHIARVVCGRIAAKGWKRVGLLGTKWTMTGSVYAEALRAHGMERLVPDEEVQAELNAAIFDELCCGEFRAETTNRFLDAIDSLRARGAECVILGCTEIPLIVNEANSSLPVLDSTRLLASAAVSEAMDPRPFPERNWVERARAQ
ncbi:MAG: amino acid racemase [Planctomycetes bacterium]|nr:amino acid racemase [Planctomycetota bacterium]